MSATTMPPPAAPELDALRDAAAAVGLACRGAFHPGPDDGVPPLADGRAAATLVLFGTVGTAQWPHFTASAEYADGAPEPLDRWSRRVIDALAARHAATALYPFDGPPWLPFQCWAQRADSVHVSPLGILIHPDFGLWHAYRGALALPARLSLPALRSRPPPCDACAARPCLVTCPVEAVRPGDFAVRACRAHLAAAAGSACRQGGCLARHACPVGAGHRHGASQAAFHMQAFIGR